MRYPGRTAALAWAFLAAAAAGAAAEPRRVSVTELLSAAPAQGDVETGRRDAPVTVVEYTSLLCPYCARFRRDGWAAIKRDFVDTGKVRWVVRDFSLGNADFAASMLARCRGMGTAADEMEAMFLRARDVAQAEASSAAFVVFARSRGFGDAELRACVNDRATYEAVDGSKRKAAERFGVTGTPTFFVDGLPYQGADGASALPAALAAAVTRAAAR